MPIPKIISFIWIGFRALPEENHKNIEAWRAQNSSFQSILWVSKPLLEEIRKTYESRGYQFTFSDPEDNKDSKNNKIEKIIASAMEEDTETGPTVVADIEILFTKAIQYLSEKEVNTLKNLIYYLMNNFTPNYGASSDLLRYLILLVYGGAYFDCDTPCLGKLSEESPYKDKDAKSKYFTLAEYIQFGMADAFTCSQGHEVTKKLIQNALKNFISAFIHAPHRFEDFTYECSTIEYTGPGLVYQVLNECPELAEPKGDCRPLKLKESVKLFPTKSLSDIHEIPSTGSWLNPPSTQCKVISEAIQISLSSMAFEAKYLEVCRFSDHAYHIGRSLKQSLLTELAEDLLKNNEYKTFLEKLINDTRAVHYRKLLDFPQNISDFLEAYFGISQKTSARILSNLMKRVSLEENPHVFGTLIYVFRSKRFAMMLIEENLMSKFAKNAEISEKITRAYRDALQATKPLRDTTELAESKTKVTWKEIDDFLDYTSPHPVESAFNSSIAQILIDSLQKKGLLNTLKKRCIQHTENDTQYRTWWEKFLGKKTTTAQIIGDGITAQAPKYGNFFKLFDSSKREKKHPLSKSEPDSAPHKGLDAYESAYKELLGKKPDFKEAIRFLKQSAELGCSPAQVALGACYQEGRGVEKNFDKAVRLYILATAQGNPRAQARLSVVYAKGEMGYKKNSEEARRLCRSAAAQGDSEAQAILGDGYCGLFPEIELPKDHTKAFHYYQLSAEQGDPLGKYGLGFCYMKGFGTKENFKEAIKFFEGAALQGNNDALELLQRIEKSRSDKVSDLGINYKSAGRDIEDGEENSEAVSEQKHSNNSMRFNFAMSSKPSSLYSLLFLIPVKDDNSDVNENNLSKQ